MNRKALGECCGLSKNIIGQYERGGREPMASSLIKLVDFFDISVEVLLGRKNL